MKKKFYLIALLFICSLTIRVFFIDAGLQNFHVNGDEGANFLQAQEISQQAAKPLFFWGQPYQFPVEAYLMSLVAPILSWDTFGVRIVPILFCTASFFIFCFLCKKLGSFSLVWPAFLLILFPSTYSLNRQTQLLTPQHSIAILLFSICALFLWYHKKSRFILLSAFAAGAFAGLSISNHLLSASMVVALSLVICLGDSFRSALKNSATYVLGLLLGLAPYIYVKIFIEGAYQKVADTLPFDKIILRLWDPVIYDLVPTAVGINTLFYPDVGPKVDTFEFFIAPFSIIFAIFIVVLILDRFLRFACRIYTNRWPSLEMPDFFLGTIILALIMASMTKMIAYPRYILFIVWSFPFIVYYAYSVLPKIPKYIFSIFVLFLVVINLVNHWHHFKFWSKKNLSHKHTFMPNKKPLYDYFKKNNITRCYAGWWLSYQVIIDTKEKYICMPPFNDRYLGWEQPFYRKEVDKTLNTPFVQGVYQHRWLTTSVIAQNFKHHRIAYDAKKVGKFKIISPKGHQDVGVSKALEPEKLIIEQKYKNLFDGDVMTSWVSKKKQYKNQILELTFNKSEMIHGLKIFSNVKNFTNAFPAIKIISIDEDGEKTVLKEKSYGLLYPLKLDPENNLVTDRTQLFFGFKPVNSKKIRIKIVKPQIFTNWEISEVQFFSEF